VPTLSDPLPEIPALKWARVGLNGDQILAFIYLHRKHLAHLVNLFFGNVYSTDANLRCALLSETDSYKKCDLNLRYLESKALADGIRPKLKLWTPVTQHFDFKVV